MRVSGLVGQAPFPALLSTVYCSLRSCRVVIPLTYCAEQYSAELSLGAFCRCLESPLSEAVSSLGLFPVNPCCSVSLDSQFCLLNSGLLLGAAWILPLSADVWKLCQGSKLDHCGVTRSLS